MNTKSGGVGRNQPTLQPPHLVERLGFNGVTERWGRFGERRLGSNALLSEAPGGDIQQLWERDLRGRYRRPGVADLNGRRADWRGEEKP